MFSLALNLNITVAEKKIKMTERNHVPQVPQLRSAFPSEISETFGADRNVKINLVVLSYARDTNQL